ncbi:ribonuclease H [Poseidonibacter parvus]|uniref:Ribonuclease H n=1 Tax=Poseidonibacter parvus TaxID=1850254 RepID=A0A1P8KNE9_9BACT|nr:RNase H family protein [Poseidonibacter parvus]APW66058.1 ribonuclease H [Poseidonibacter parvus]
MKNIKLFVDGSCNPQEKIGFGAYVLIDDENYDLEYLKSKVILQRFENTSSTKLEIQTFLWALEDIDKKESFIKIYTDCQNIIGLPKRKEKLKSLNYHSSSGKILNNSQLYKKFFELTQKYNCEFIKVEGHKKNSLKNDIDNIFNIVDKASRSALRGDKSI